MKISVIIPAFNEESTIEKILFRVLKQKNIGEIILVDDGSSDNTLKIANRIQAKSKKVRVVSHKTNLGKGAAIKTGIKNVKMDLTIIQDADLEYDPSEFKTLLEKSGGTKVVYGSRMLGGNPHAYFTTYLGNLVLTKFCNILFNTKLTDIYTCYKLIPSKILKKIDIKSEGFEMEAEITAKILKSGYKISEVPISYKPRTYEKGKKIKAWDAILGIVTLLKIRLS